MRAGWELFRCWLINQPEVAEHSSGDGFTITGTDLVRTGEDVPRQWVFGPGSINEERQLPPLAQAEVEADAVSALVGTSLFTGWQDYGRNTANVALTVAIIAGGDSAGSASLSLPYSYNAVERVGDIVHRFPDPASWANLPEVWPDAGWPAACQPAAHEIIDQRWQLKIITGGAESLYLDDDNYYLEIAYELALARAA